MPETSEWSLVVCGGGSGGHLFPALAVIDELKRQRCAPREIVFLSSDKAIDRHILDSYGVRCELLPSVDSHQLKRHPWQSMRQLLTSVWTATGILKQLPQPVVLGTGGFGSVPGGLAARWRKCPLILLEQNVIPGRATMLLTRFARTICVSFSETKQWLPNELDCKVTGNPVRPAIAFSSRDHVPHSERNVLILGGSQGATALNEAMIKFAASHAGELQGWTLSHQTGISACESTRQRYQEIGVRAEVAPFFHNMAERYRRASLVVTRAGGTSLAEIACAGLPALTIPFPRSMRNHQQINARHFVGKGAAIMVEESQASFHDEFAEALSSLLTDENFRNRMSAAMQMCARPDAAEQVAHVLLDCIAGVP